MAFDGFEVKAKGDFYERIFSMSRQENPLAFAIKEGGYKVETPSETQRGGVQVQYEQLDILDLIENAPHDLGFRMEDYQDELAALVTVAERFLAGKFGCGLGEPSETIRMCSGRPIGLLKEICGDMFGPQYEDGVSPSDFVFLVCCLGAAHCSLYDADIGSVSCVSIGGRVLSKHTVGVILTKLLRRVVARVEYGYDDTFCFMDLFETSTHKVLNIQDIIAGKTSRAEYSPQNAQYNVLEEAVALSDIV